MLNKGNSLVSFLSLVLFLTLVGGTASADEKPRDVINDFEVGNHTEYSTEKANGDVVTLNIKESEKTKEYFNGFEVIKSTKKTTINENGEEVTVSFKELRATKDDLEKLISGLKEQGHNIYSEADLSQSEISPESLSVGGGQYKGSHCNTDYSNIQICAYPNITVKMRLGGLTGMNFSGNITAIAAPTTGSGDSISNHKAVPRLRVMGYGITGRDSIVVGEWNFRSPISDNFINSWDVDENTGGVLAYVEFWAGADFSWNLYSNSYSATVWAPLTKQ